MCVRSQKENLLPGLEWDIWGIGGLCGHCLHGGDKKIYPINIAKDS